MSLVLSFLFTLISFFVTSSQFSYGTPLNIIVLGADPRNDWLENNLSTDTIIFTSLNFSKNKIDLLSLPRDLYITSKGYKINQIYQHNLRNPSQLKKEYSSLLGLNIDRFLVITTQDLISLIEIVGSVDVYNTYPFTDFSYPNPKYITDPKNNPMYISVSYPTGWLRLDKDSAIPFIRSRKSQQNGTDLGRINRQQLFLMALKDKMLSTKNLLSPHKITNYYRWYQNLETDIRLTDIYYLSSYFIRNFKELSFVRHQIPIGDNRHDLIYHPNKFVTSEWVYLTKDPTFKQLQQFIHQSLNP